MKKILVCLAVAMVSAPAMADVVTERWGASARCRHAKSARFAVSTAGGVVATFDLAGLPKGAKVLRARLLPFVRTGGVPLAQPLLVHALKAAPPDQGDPPVTGKALALAAPRFMSFDATDVVRQWASGRLANHGLWIRGARFDRRRCCLEITYEGKLADPPPPVTGLKAFYRAGQVFLTWGEVNTPFTGKDKVPWKDLEADLKAIGAGTKPVTTYRIYRHSRPITAKTLTDAELLDEVVQHSAFDQSEIRTSWKGEQIKNVRVPEALVPRTSVEAKTELPVATGVWVGTVRKAGTFYYAVVAAVDGVENTTALDAANTAGPIAEKVAPPQPILVRIQKHQYHKDRKQHCYVWWLDEPLFNLPTFTHLSVSPEEKPTPGPKPFVVSNWWWSSGWSVATQYPLPEAVGFVIDHNCMKTRGTHEGNGTCKAWSEGKVRPYFVRQLKALLPWIKAKYNIDEDRMYALSSGWAWHYPDLFAVAFECTTMNPKRSPAGMECRRYWGDPKRPAPTEWGQSAWEYWNAGAWIAAHPAVELPLITYAPRMHTGDFGRLDKAPLYRALLDTKRAWSAIFHEGSLIGHRDPSWMFQIRRSDSLAAFGNCTLDDDPGIGFGWTPRGQMNAYLCFDPRSQTDAADRWEMTVYLTSGDKRGRGAAPVDQCTADVTPRRCQKFKAKPGEKFTWTNTSVKDKKVVQTGQAVADKHGLATATDVIITKGKNRLLIEKAK